MSRVVDSGSGSTRQLLDQPLRMCLGTLLDGVGAYEAVRDPSGRILDFDIVYTNQQGAAAAGGQRRAAGRPAALRRVPGGSRNGTFDRYCDVVEKGEPIIEGEIERGGRWWERRVSRLGDGLLAVWRDISDRKRMEVELRRSSALLNAVMKRRPRRSS